MAGKTPAHIEKIQVSSTDELIVNNLHSTNGNILDTSNLLDRRVGQEIGKGAEKDGLKVVGNRQRRQIAANDGSWNRDLCNGIDSGLYLTGPRIVCFVSR